MMGSEPTLSDSKLPLLSVGWPDVLTDYKILFARYAGVSLTKLSLLVVEIGRLAIYLTNAFIYFFHRF